MAGIDLRAFCYLDSLQPQPFLEHADRRIAVAGIDIALFLSGKAPLRRFRVGIDEPGIEEQRLGGLAMVGALDAAPDQPRRLSGAFEDRVLARWLQHQPCTQGSPTAFQPPTVPR